MYTSNETIVTFLNKAQNKIAEIATELVSRGGEGDALISLSMQLSHVVRALDNQWNNWTEEEILAIIDYYNQAAELNVIPFLVIDKYQTNITGTVVNSGGKTTSVTELVDFVSAVKALIATTSHNSLGNIQGGKSGELYHVDKAMYDKLYALTYPFTAPKVSLAIVGTSPSTTGQVFELGTSLSSVKLQGGITLNDGKSVLKAQYLKAGEALGSELTGPGSTASHTDTAGISATTQYGYRATFEQGGTLTTYQTITATPPYWGADDAIGYNAAQVIAAGTKRVVAKPGQINFTYTLPAGNATGKTETMYLLVPKSWGLFKRILVDENPTFDYINAWIWSNAKVMLGTLETDYYLYVFNDFTEGTFNFNFKWQ